ncbi:DUF2835 domain-containing protein [Psychrobium sp. 1_MG-2023]|uniref:DUF2835 domain-containing protein n=1 Tax=Psychrobium sp. 1_MG-2023 TaxID=3062624 RepID=UPI000C328C21|nr:DUF2835 domain-containing protein [Psychrobium sp. 1_MG-2023]MDP2560373.1 DUF2835 domain-containing protein [Psychrobium sp. 1_MG-2023]PKF55483.1 DUF2835 domain-containing protein [Alteromonadales bacterium alter-6D02]
MMKKYYFNMALSYDRFLPVYQGAVNKVQVTDRQGLKIELPAEHFKPFLTRDGIYGNFELVTSGQGKFISLNRIN